MAKAYLPRDHPDVYLDCPIKERTLYGSYVGRPGAMKYVRPDPEDLVECPVCNGHGKGNLELNAYGPGRHFQWSCSQCTGWGWVLKGSPDALCVHVDGPRVNVGNCLNNYTCTKCGRVKQIDSSG